MNKRNLLLLVVFAGFAYFIIRSFNSMAEPQQLHLPLELKGLQASEAKPDDPDVARIGQIRPAGTRVFQEATRVYGEGNDKTVLWVGIVKNSDEASRFLRTAGPGLNSLPGLSGARELNMMGRPSWMAQGQGMRHILLTERQLVIYVGTRLANPQPVIQEILQHPMMPSGI